MDLFRHGLLQITTYGNLNINVTFPDLTKTGRLVGQELIFFT